MTDSDRPAMLRRLSGTIGPDLIVNVGLPFLLINPMIGYARMGALSLWTFRYARRHGLNGDSARSAGPASCDSDNGVTFEAATPGFTPHRAR